jgi:hypothetical protein
VPADCLISQLLLIAGFVLSYIAVQLPFLVLVNVAVILWGLAFPFHYRSFKTTGKTRHIHAAIVILALTLPLPFALVHLKDGFVAVVYPTSLCVGRNIDLTYYFVILPQSVLFCITAIILVFVLWIVFKVCPHRVLGGGGKVPPKHPSFPPKHPPPQKKKEPCLMLKLVYTETTAMHYCMLTSSKCIVSGFYFWVGLGGGELYSVTVSTRFC